MSPELALVGTEDDWSLKMKGVIDVSLSPATYLCSAFAAEGYFSCYEHNTPKYPKAVGELD